MSLDSPGAARKTSYNRVINHVTDQTCPSRKVIDGTHVLINDEMKTVCLYCGLTWAELDGELNLIRRAKKDAD